MKTFGGGECGNKHTIRGKYDIIPFKFMGFKASLVRVFSEKKEQPIIS